MRNADKAKDNFMYTIAAEATDAYDDAQNAVDEDSRSTAVRSLRRIELIYDYYENDGVLGANARYATPYTTRRAMARSALLLAGISEDAQQAVDTIRLATTHSEAEIQLATGDLDSFGLVTVK
jgi:hypothetical protein